MDVTKKPEIIKYKLFIMFLFFAEKVTTSRLSCQASQERAKPSLRNMPCGTLRPSAVRRQKRRWRKKCCRRRRSWRPSAMPKPLATTTRQGSASSSKFNSTRTTTSSEQACELICLKNLESYFR